VAPVNKCGWASEPRARFKHSIIGEERLVTTLVKQDARARWAIAAQGKYAAMKSNGGKLGLTVPEAFRPRHPSHRLPQQRRGYC